MLTKEKMTIIEQKIKDLIQSMDANDSDIRQIEMLEEELYEMKTVVNWLNSEWNKKKKTYIENDRQYVKLINWTPFNFKFVRLYLEMIKADGKRDIVIAEADEWPARSERKVFFDKVFPDGVQLKGDGERVEFEIKR